MSASPTLKYAVVAGLGLAVGLAVAPCQRLLRPTVEWGQVAAAAQPLPVKAVEPAPPPAPSPLPPPVTPTPARSPDPFPERPVFIFARDVVTWDELVPNLEATYGRVPREVLDTFPVPGNFAGTDLDLVSWDSERIRFVEPGEYYLHTRVGFFKILILPEGDDEQVLAIARFVTRNSSTARPTPARSSPTSGTTPSPPTAARTLFASDQLRLHCGYLSMFLGHLLGGRATARLVQLHTPQRNRPRGTSSRRRTCPAVSSSC